MNKKVKWGIIISIGAGLIGGGIYSQLPKENEELAAADKVMTGKRGEKKILNVNAQIIKPQLLKDEIQISGSLLPDEEVDLSFETSGKIIEINFEEGSFVKKGQLLAKVNDRPLQAQLQRLVSQLTCRRPMTPSKGARSSVCAMLDSIRSMSAFRVASSVFTCS